MNSPSNYHRPPLNIKDAEPCPQCGQAAGKRIRYSWWGGALGPAMISLTKCQACGYQFNAKTGKSVKNAIIGYQLVVFALCVLIMIAGYFMRNQ